MKKKSKPAVDKVMTGIIVVWGLLAFGLLIYDSMVSGNPIFSRISAGTALSATVSANGTTYASSIYTTQNQGYRLKLGISNYNGPIEVYSRGTAVKWMNPRTGQPFMAKNSIVTITPEDMKLIPINAGIYPARFRPHTGVAVNNYNWSNQVIVVVNATSGTTPGLVIQVSLDGKTWTNNISTTLDKGYYLRTNPGYIGWLEAAAGKKWLQADDNGVVRVTPTILKNGTAYMSAAAPGTYTARFRPHTGTTNNFPWSNQVTIVLSSPQTSVNPAAFVKTSCSMSSKTANQLNLASYNVGDDGDVWKDGLAHDPARVAAMAKLLMTTRSAEIIALQEIKHEVADGETKPPELSYIKTYFPGYSILTRPHNSDNDYSNVILSKFPFVSGTEKELLMTEGRGNDRRNLSVIVNTPRGKVRVFAIHTRYEQPGSQTKEIAAWVKSVTSSEPGIPFVVMGDFNQSDSNNKSAFSDAKVSVVSPGFPGIDHIYLNSLSINEKCRIGNGGISGGHDPVFITTN